MQEDAIEKLPRLDPEQWLQRGSVEEYLAYALWVPTPNARGMATAMAAGHAKWGGARATNRAQGCTRASSVPQVPSKTQVNVAKCRAGHAK